MKKTIITSVVLAFSLSAYLWANQPSEFGSFVVKTSDTVKQVIVSPHLIIVHENDLFSGHKYEDEGDRYKLINSHNRPSYLYKSDLHPVALFDIVEDDKIIDGYYFAAQNGWGISIEIEGKKYRALIVSIDRMGYYFETGEIEKNDSFIELTKKKPQYPCQEEDFRNFQIIYLQGEDSLTFLFYDGNTTKMARKDFSVWKALDLLYEKRLSFVCPSKLFEL